MHVFGDVRVLVVCEGGFLVPEVLGEGLFVDTGGGGIGCVGVAETVERDVGQSFFFEDPFERAVDAVGIDRLFAVGNAREDPFGADPFVPFFQKIHHAFRQDDRTDTRVGFRVPDFKPALDRDDLPFHRQRSVLGVEVFPPQSAEFPAPEPRQTLGVEEVVPPRFFPDRFEELFELVLVQRLADIIVEFRKRGDFGRIFHDNVLFDRHLKAIMKHGVHGADGAAREPFALFRIGDDASLFEKFYVECLHVSCLDRGDLFLPEVRADVCARVEFVFSDRGMADDLSFVCQPTVEPFVQRHDAVLGQLHAPVDLLQLAELCHRFRLREPEDRFVDRLFIFFVPDDDARFPSSVGSFSNSSVPVRTSFAHSFHLLLAQTIPQSFSYIQTKTEELSESYQIPFRLFHCFLRINI